MFTRFSQRFYQTASSTPYFAEGFTCVVRGGTLQNAKWHDNLIGAFNALGSDATDEVDTYHRDRTGKITLHHGPYDTRALFKREQNLNLNTQSSMSYFSTSATTKKAPAPAPEFNSYAKVCK